MYVSVYFPWDYNNINNNNNHILSNKENPFRRNQ